MDSNTHQLCSKSKYVDLEKSLLWKLRLGRNKACKEMNSDLDEIVDQCLKARRHLEAVEDSNANLMREVRSLSDKYEALLEKNRKDTNIIMKLKDSESLLKQALKKRKETDDSLQKVQLENKEKALQRKLLQDNREKLLFKSQTVTNTLRKINLKHKRIYELIERENKIGEENETRLTTEINELRSRLSQDDSILEDWLKDNVKRDDAIHRLQKDIKDGLTVPAETNEDLNSEASSVVDTSSIEQDTDVEDLPKESSGTLESDPGKTDAKEMFRREWIRKKTLYEAAEKLKEHWMNFYMLLNQRMQELNIEIINVREWCIDKQAQKKDALERVKQMEQLVSQKRRNKPVPPRSSIVELDICIKVQRDLNEAYRKLSSKCLSVKTNDSKTYLDFAKSTRDMYLDALKEQFSSVDKTEDKTAEGGEEAESET